MRDAMPHGRSHRYTMLMASLPHLGGLFAAKQTPLSRLQLDRRLALLTEEDAGALARIEAMLIWGRHPLDRAEGPVLDQARALLESLTDPDLQRIVERRLDIRTLVVALRRRHRGLPPPAPRSGWGVSPWADVVARNWSEPDFRLGRVHPWLAEANRLLAAGDAYGLERLLLATVWTELGRLGEGHEFDFPAVVVYVLRWDLIARWTAQDAPAAAIRFDRLLAAGMMAEGAVDQPSAVPVR